MQDIPLPPYSNNRNSSNTIINVIIGVLLILLVALKLSLAVFFPPRQGQASDLAVENILNAVNRERQLRSLLTLNANQLLAVAAQSKADDMMARHYFSHTDPEGNYVWPKIEAAGYAPYSQLGENLAIEFTNTESLVSAWMNSPTHRANILNENFKDQGMGLAFGDVALNQYRSAIANTFGALLITHKQPVLASGSNSVDPKNQSSQPAVSKPVANAVPAKTATQPAAQKPAASPVAALSSPAAPATSAPAAEPKTGQPLAIRGNGEAPAFATSQHAASSAPAQIATGTSAAVKPAAALLAQNQNQLAAFAADLNSAQNSRYITLGIGFLLLLLLLSDLRITLQKTLRRADKKINNFVLLILSILVVALMYWL